MPSSVNGIGTGLVAASRKRKIHGQTQFDAIEAFMFCYLPLFPFRALHILDIGPQGRNVYCEQYRFVPLSLSCRLIFKAFLNRWGNVLCFFGGLNLAFVSYIFTMMARPLNSSDHNWLMFFAACLIVGVFLKGIWFLLSRRDEKIKDLIAPHGQGASDPRYWVSAQADATIQSILQQESLPSLIEVVRHAMKEGKRSFAAFCLRLAMRDPNNIEAQDLMNKMLTE